MARATKGHNIQSRRDRAEEEDWWIALRRDPDRLDELVHAYESSPRRLKCSLKDFASGFEAAHSGDVDIALPRVLAIVSPISAGRFRCEECGRTLTEKLFQDGQVWSPSELASRGRERFGRTLCMRHYSIARKEIRRAAVMRGIQNTSTG